MINYARRGQGVPFTEEQRMERHYSLYGNYNLPPRGTGLGQDDGEVGEPIITTPWVCPLIGAGVGFVVGKQKMVWALAGGLLGWGLYSWYKAAQKEQPL